MFAGGYFAKSYFAGSYWAPTQAAVVQPRPSTGAGSGGGRASRRRPSKVRLRKDDVRRLVMEALEKARDEGRLVRLDEFYDVNPDGQRLWRQVKDRVADQVEESVATAFAVPGQPAFSESSSTIVKEIMETALRSVEGALIEAKRSIEEIDRYDKRQEAKRRQKDEDDILALLLLMD